MGRFRAQPGSPRRNLRPISTIAKPASSIARPTQPYRIPSPDTPIVMGMVEKHTTTQPSTVSPWVWGGAEFKVGRPGGTAPAVCILVAT